MNGKLIFVPDTHVVVPREATEEIKGEICSMGYDEAEHVYADAIEAATRASSPITTPPVLRWDDNELVEFDNLCIAFVRIIGSTGHP